MPELVLSIIAAGTPQHPRFQVADPNQRFWTGDGWSSEEAVGRLYCSVNDAARTIQEILLAQYGDKPVRRFVAPVCLDLHFEKELSLDQITKWLVKVARLTIDAEQHGNGPIWWKPSPNHGNKWSPWKVTCKNNAPSWTKNAVQS